jgi:catechol 2,3-dioxygenase-like lactoylglutathione lyase family enzyme
VEPCLDVITLAVADFERALAFYRSIGLESKGIIGSEMDRREDRRERRDRDDQARRQPDPKPVPARRSGQGRSDFGRPAAQPRVQPRATRW